MVDASPRCLPRGSGIQASCCLGQGTSKDASHRMARRRRQPNPNRHLLQLQLWLLPLLLLVVVVLLLVLLLPLQFQIHLGGSLPRQHLLAGCLLLLWQVLLPHPRFVLLSAWGYTWRGAQQA